MASKTAKKFTSSLQVESEFLNFFCDFIPKIYSINGKKELNNFSDALHVIRDSRSKNSLDKEQETCVYVDVEYHKPIIRFAYLYAYSVLHACVVHHHFLRYLKEYADLRTLISRKKCLNICCLGGGPGVEAIAISKIMNDFVKSLNPIGCHPQNSEENVFTVYVTVIDICKEWEAEMLAIMNAINNCSDILNSGRIKISANFIQADLLQDIKPDFEKQIVEADIVTVVKVGSDIHRTAPENTKKLSNNICRIGKLLKENSCIFIVENAGGSVFSQLKLAVNNESKSTNIKSSLHQLYSLNPKTVLKIEEICVPSDSTRSDVASSLMTTVSSCIWVKSKKRCEDKKNQECNKIEKQSNDKTERKSKKIEKHSKDKKEPKSKKKHCTT